MRRILCAICLLALGLAGCGRQGTGAGQAQRANMVFILTDDMDLALLEYMPKTKQLLGAEGASFQNFFVSMATCCPSRATILRGQYAHNTQIFETELPDGGFEKFYAQNSERSTLATWLQDAGYRTALVGKYLNGYPNTVKQSYIPPGWTEWYSPADGDPYTQFNYTLNENGKLVAYGDAPEDYGTDVFAARSVDFIGRSLQQGKPFFLQISVYAPHSPYEPAPRHAGLFLDVPLVRSPSFDEADVEDKPAIYRQEPPLKPDHIAKMERVQPKRFQSMQAVDELVQAVVQALEAGGALENTYIFLTSDNGFHMGQHRLLLGKNTGFEEDIHVPLLVRGPGIPAGSVIPALAGNVDLAPTFAEIAGAQLPDFVDGRSLLPWLQGGAGGTWRQGFLLERARLDEAAFVLDLMARRPNFMSGLMEPPDSPERAKIDRAFRGVRTLDYTFLQYGDGTRELYDMRKDPYQLENLAGSASQEFLNAVGAWVERLRKCEGEACRQIEAQPAPGLK